MVSRASAVGCHPLREVPSLRRRGSTCRRRGGSLRQPLGRHVHCFTIMQDLIFARVRVKQRDGAEDDRRTTLGRAVKHTSARPEAPADCSDQSFSEVSALLSPIARRFPFHPPETLVSSRGTPSCASAILPVRIASSLLVEFPSTDRCGHVL